MLLFICLFFVHITKFCYVFYLRFAVTYLTRGLRPSMGTGMANFSLEGLKTRKFIRGYIAENDLKQEAGH